MTSPIECYIHPSNHNLYNNHKCNYNHRPIRQENDHWP